MRFLIIGGTNFIGPYVVRYLAAAGHEVTVFHRRQTTAARAVERSDRISWCWWGG